MTFPTIANVNANTSSANTNSFAVSMPASISAGDLLIVIHTWDGNTLPTTPVAQGWHVHRFLQGTAVSAQICWKYAQGSDALTFTTAANESHAARSYRITGHSPTIPIEWAVTGATATTGHNPPALTPTWGAADTLWIAYVGLDGNSSCSGYPASYSNTGTNTSTEATSTDRVGQGYATRTNNTATEDPGAFTNTSAAGIRFTIGIPPADLQDSRISIQTRGSVNVTAAASSTTQSVTLAAAYKRRLFVCVGFEHATGNGDVVSSITYGGNTLTAVTDGTTSAVNNFSGTVDSYIGWWYLDEANMPADGANNLVVTCNSSHQFSVGWWILNKCSQRGNIDQVIVNTGTSGTTVTATLSSVLNANCAFFSMAWKNTASANLSFTSTTLAGKNIGREFTYLQSTAGAGETGSCNLGRTSAGSNAIVYTWASNERNHIVAFAVCPYEEHPNLMGANI